MEALELLAPDQVKEIDRESIENHKIPEILLMEDAAYGIYNIIKKKFSEKRVIIVCGPGNNGGDGMALARILEADNFDVSLTFTHGKSYTGASLTNYKLSKHIKKLDLAYKELTSNTLIVDAIFGIGLNRVIDKETSTLINRVNNAKSKVLSVDIPSGISGLTGEVLGKSAIKADITATIYRPKIGMYLFPGYTHCGHIEVVNISIPQDLVKDKYTPYINSPIALTPRVKNCHKTTYGKVLAVAGSSNYYGAPYFTSKATLISGSGFTTLISEKEVIKSCAQLAPELVFREDCELQNSLKESSVVVFGPGLGLNSRTDKLFMEVVKSSPKKLIIDADGITTLSKTPNIIKNFQGDLIMTPHPGEAAKLLDTTIESIEKNRIQSAKDISQKYNCFTVLKGAHTVIATPGKSIFINICSSSTLATAGSGDILCGVIAGLLCRIDTVSAVRASVYIHGLAGKKLESSLGREGSTANNILAMLPEALNSYIDICP